MKYCLDMRLKWKGNAPMFLLISYFPIIRVNHLRFSLTALTWVAIEVRQSLGVESIRIYN